MSEIKKLIERLCPDGVEYKKLGEVAKCYSGATPKTGVAAYWENGTIPWMNSGEVNSGRVFQTEKKITQAGFESCSTKMVPPHTVVIALAGQGKTRGTVAITEIELCTNQSLCAVEVNESIVNSYFLWHYLRGQYQTLRKISSGDGTRGGLNQIMIRNFEIPVPPIEVQSKIVEILDNFTELEAELEAQLEAELEARKKQYEYYRNQLLTFDKVGGARFDVKWMKLGEVCNYVDYRGKTPKKVDFGIFLVTAKNIRKGYIDYEKSKEYISEEDYDIVMRRGKPMIGDVLITTEAPCGNVAQIDDDTIALAQRVIKYRPKDSSLNSCFLKYVLLGNEFQKKLLKEATGATAKGIKGSKLHNLSIPIPPLEEQQRIVSILDRFDALTTDLQSGLPAEIEARHKQYEYYREQLLTFKRKTA